MKTDDDDDDEEEEEEEPPTGLQKEVKHKMLLTLSLTPKCLRGSNVSKCMLVLLLFLFLLFCYLVAQNLIDFSSLFF